MCENILTEIREKYSELNKQHLLPSQDGSFIEACKNFFDEYNPEIIKNLEGEKLLNCVAFVTGDSESLGQKLERGLNGDYFGNFGGLQTPVRYMENVWATGSVKTKKVITKEQAILYAEKIKLNIIRINQVILNIKSNTGNYQDLLDAFDNIDEDFEFALSYFKKYFSILYPELFTSLVTNKDFEGINTFVGINEVYKSLILEKFLFENFPKINVCDTYWSLWKIFEENVLKIRDEFIKYLQTSVVQESPSYSSYIEADFIKKSNFAEKIRECTGKNVYEITDVYKLEELFADLKDNKLWGRYNKSKGNGIPNAILHKHYKNFIEKILNTTADTGEKTMNDKDKTPLNQILYGPPGTGKTYNTIIEAMKIIDKNCIEYNSDNTVKNYEIVRENFKKYKALGQIEFVTFHQSYSYEEFVEGIKPDLTSGDLKYIREHGCFRRVCDAAKKLQENKIVYNFNYEKLSLYKILIPDENLYENCIENNFVAINWGDNINFENCKNEQDLDKIVPINYEHRKQCISQMNMFKLWIDKDLKDGKDVIAIIPGSMNSIKGIAKITGDYKYNENTEFGLQQRTVEWIKTDINIPSEYIYESKFVSPTITGMFKEKIKKDNLMSLLNSTKESKSKNAVLIIDEINRGNISKIFGELITLIEEDKRENLSVRLPYSKDVFTVPKNLYIIGTMNTSDRSIASIDIALRRRFKFKEIMPNSNLVADFNCNFKECFEILNKRISVLLDRDHQIGHSYFIEEKYKDSNASELETIWFDSIIPLLNEYFYSDWEKLQALLGNAKKDNTSFIKVVENVSFAKEYSCEEDEMFDFNAKCDFKAAMQNAFGDKFRG